MNPLVKIHISLALAGLAVAAYLFSVKVFNLDPICGVSTCGIVNNSEFSILLGLPVSAWGMMYYILVAIIGIELNTIHQSRKPFLHIASNLALKKNLFKAYGARLHDFNIFVTALGFLFSLYLTYLEAFVILAWCQWCVVSAWISICLFLLSFRIYKLKVIV